MGLLPWATSQSTVVPLGDSSPTSGLSATTVTRTAAPKHATKSEPLPVWISAVAGTVSGAITAFAMAPLDITRTRHMVNKHSGKKIHQTFTDLLKKDGWRGLYAGLTPTLFGLMPTWAISWSTYHFARNYQTEVMKLDSQSPFVHIRAAMLAGIATAVGTNPIWVVKTRIQTQTMSGEGPRYSGVINCGQTIFREEGFKGLYKGLTPSLFGVFHVCVQFPIYEQLKLYMARRSNLDSPQDLSTDQILVSSAIAKAVASIAAYPHEVLRVKQQKDRQGAHRELTKLVQYVFATQGIRGFYRGMSLNLFRVVPTAAITFTSFEFFSVRLLHWDQSRRSASSGT